MPYGRNEDEAQRLDRNYNELLQELRVAQTGAQILFAFLLAIAFQPRFERLSVVEEDLYVATLLCSAVAVVMFIAPVAVHRSTVGRRLKDRLVSVSARLAIVGLASLGLSMLGAILLTVGLVASQLVAIVVTSAAALMILALWLALPHYIQRQEQEGND